MVRWKLRNKFLKEKNEQLRNDYRKQCNLCVIRRSRCFSSLDLSLIADNKKIWKTAKPLFSDKLFHRDIISLTGKEKTITKDLQIAEIFNNYFSNVVRSLCDRNVPTKPRIACSQNSVFTAINKFKNHPRERSTVT